MEGLSVTRPQFSSIAKTRSTTSRHLQVHKYTHRKEVHTQSQQEKYYINVFVTIVHFLYPLKRSENLTVFRYFQEIEGASETNGLRFSQVNLLLANVSIYTPRIHLFANICWRWVSNKERNLFLFSLMLVLNSFSNFICTKF